MEMLERRLGEAEKDNYHDGDFPPVAAELRNLMNHIIQSPRGRNGKAPWRTRGGISPSMASWVVVPGAECPCV
jgi:hypothetical protein